MPLSQGAQMHCSALSPLKQDLTAYATAGFPLALGLCAVPASACHWLSHAFTCAILRSQQNERLLRA